MLVPPSRLRSWGSRAINWLGFAVLLGSYRDTQSGLKAFRSDVARFVFARTRVDGFAFDIEVLHLVERHQLSLVEVPVDVANSSRSTVHAARDAGRLIVDLFRIRHWAAAGAYEAEGDLPAGAGGRRACVGPVAEGRPSLAGAATDAVTGSERPAPRRRSAPRCRAAVADRGGIWPRVPPSAPTRIRPRRAH